MCDECRYLKLFDIAYAVLPTAKKYRQTNNRYNRWQSWPASRSQWAALSNDRRKAICSLLVVAEIPLYTDNAKSPKDPSIPRTECGLRQQGARRRNRDLGADCLERRSGSQLRDGKHGDRKSGRT
eukprot:6214224-Pleurochrysis_carterae.AAC.1